MLGIDGALGFGTFNWLHQIAGLALVAIALAGPAVIRARWPQADESARWAVGVVAGAVAFFLLPVQLLAAGSTALMLAGTSRRSPAKPRTLAVGTSVGLTAGLIVWWLAVKLGELGGAWFILAPLAALLASVPAGLAASWLLSGDEDPQKLRTARILQGQLAGAAVGAACGLTLTSIFIGAGFMLLMGPLAGLGGGTIGGRLSVQQPRLLRPAAPATGAEAAPGSPA
jgi:hypothetical protein